MSTSNRLAFFDNLRIVLVAMVITHHAGQAYGPTGMDWPIREQTVARILDPFFMVNRSFGIGLLFMIAGFFVAMSCARSGPAALARSRLQRLGLPLLGFSLLMIPLQVFVFGPALNGSLGAPWPISVLHLWFVQHLLIYSLGYALWCRLRPAAVQPVAHPLDPPAAGTVIVFAAGMALATAIVRTWFDIDEWVNLFGYISIAPADLARDLSLFVAGTVAYRHNWVARFPAAAGRRWLAAGLALAGVWYVYRLWLTDVLVLSDTVWGLLLPLWEALLACSMCIGLTVLFRDRLAASNALLDELGKSSYAAYMVHLFIVIFVQALLLGLLAPPLLKFAAVTLITVPLSFLLAGLIRRPLRL